MSARDKQLIVMVVMVVVPPNFWCWSFLQSIIARLDPVFPSLISLPDQMAVNHDKANSGAKVVKGLPKAVSSFCLSDGVS